VDGIRSRSGGLLGCNGFRCTVQCPSSRRLGSDRRSGCRVRSSVPRRMIPPSHYRSKSRFGPSNAVDQDPPGLSRTRTTCNCCPGRYRRSPRVRGARWGHSWSPPSGRKSRIAPNWARRSSASTRESMPPGTRRFSRLTTPAHAQLHRRLNILINFNEGRLPEWGGQLELWNQEVCERMGLFPNLQPLHHLCNQRDQLPRSHQSSVPAGCCPPLICRLLLHRGRPATPDRENAPDRIQSPTRGVGQETCYGSQTCI
jgi:hypothetical protein